MADDHQEDVKKKISTGIDKIVMGAIIGGAIGSVLGMTFAPKSGKETRKAMWRRVKDWFKKGKEAKEEFMEKHGDQIEMLKGKVTEKRKGLISFLKSKFSSEGREKAGKVPFEDERE